MLIPRVMPSLLLRGAGLVKTVQFSNPRYLGDPRNAVRIFNEKEVDELVLLDITATTQRHRPQFDLIGEIASEAFMPVAYGGGITSVEDIQATLAVGIEKVVIGSHAVSNPALVKDAARAFGSSTIVVCIDVKRSMFGTANVFTHSGTRKAGADATTFARMMEDAGAGELIVNSIDRDGTMAGFDVPLIRSVADAVSLPVIACGGAGSLSHVKDAIKEGHASAVAAGSLFVYQGKHKAVLISYPTREALAEATAT